MNTLKTNIIALAIVCAFTTGAMAQGLSQDEYKAGKAQISAEYKADKAACAAFSGNAKDVCVLEARGKEKVAKADLDARNKPSVKTRYEARVTRAEADYKVAREHCDDLAGNAKDVCVKEAKAAEIAAKADAKAGMKISDANAMAEQKSYAARSDAANKTAEARQDATADKRDAEYKVAKEKCDTYAGDTKDTCLNQAKARFGQ